MIRGSGPKAQRGGATRPFVMLGLLAIVEWLGMSGWFVGGALAHHLAAAWLLTPSQVAWLTSAVQLGFVAGTLVAAVLNLADLVPARWLVAVAALGASAANGSLLLVDGYGGALLTRFLLGFCLAGVYPPAMKMAATWFRDRRGLAIGVVVGSLTIGKASPYFVEALGGLSLSVVVGSTAGAAAVAGLLVAALYRDGPFAFPTRSFSWRLVGEITRVPALRLVTAGYLGHMWELYAFWGFIAAYWAAALESPAPATVAALAGSSIAIGAVGCVVGGLAADRIGRERVVLWSLAVSGAAAVGSAMVFEGPAWLRLVVIFSWGIAIIADSAQYSALVTELAPPYAVGTALTLQTSLGFLLTMAAIQVVAELGGPGTPWAFPALAVGPALGFLAIRAVARRRLATVEAGA